jgi:hypothetical protein
VIEMSARHRTLSVLAVALCALAASGCIASETYRARAFVPQLRHYRVRYVAGGDSARRVLPEGWSVAGYRVDGQGRPTEPFRTAEETVAIGVDLDGDRRSDVRGVAPRYDLRYEHDDDGAVLAASTVPMDPRHARRSLAILAHALLDGAFGEGFVTRGRDQERAYVTRLIDEQEARVGGAPAYSLTFELAPVVPGEGPAYGRGETMTVVIVRPGTLRWREHGVAGTGDGVPMLIVLTYSARSERYALHRADFDALLDRLDVRPDGLGREER